ncbi:hypothetical protein N9O16_01850 [Candidatus Poseidoniaceae archaeon]|nr:hypothetical protein [Euryarchaeota archaeon]MDA9166215.1 hypothetical protein [Candidatus Poseidoniaceae archaeon]
MMTLDDLKTNRDTQITVGCIAFFLIAFPLYFSFAASGVSSVAGTRGVGDYQINGNLTYVQLTDGIEYIADGDTYMIDDLHTDAIDDAEDLNIVGVRVVMSYGEDEETQGTCNPLTQGQPAADTISGTAMHAGFNGTADGQNNGGSGEHEVVVEWFNSSMVGAEVSGLSESEIISQIDSMGAGLGAYSAEIGVSAEAGNTPPPGLCSRSDNGEEVTFSVELIVFDYTIAPVFNEAEL